MRIHNWVERLIMYSGTCFCAEWSEDLDRYALNWISSNQGRKDYSFGILFCELKLKDRTCCLKPRYSLNIKCFLTIDESKLRECSVQSIRIINSRYQRIFPFEILNVVLLSSDLNFCSMILISAPQF